MAELDAIKKALGCFAGNGNVPDDCPCCFKNIHGADCERNVATFTLELIESQEQTIKNLLMQIEDIGKPELVNTDEENYAHLPVTKCPRCKRPIRMYYDPCHTALTKACPYCGKVVAWE